MHARHFLRATILCCCLAGFTVAAWFAPNARTDLVALYLALAGTCLAGLIRHLGSGDGYTPGRWDPEGDLEDQRRRLWRTRDPDGPLGPP